ncbi:hypothetical protein [Brevundimonas diminuta]|uniref:hypothetical protein n=1 Tax=Brevundimonas diminuta TaxID=293 RepID=UPI00320B4BB0
MLPGRFGRRRDVPALPDQARADQARPEPPDGVDDLLAEIGVMETAARQIYARHGLPDQPGHYRRAGEDAPWEKIADRLTPSEKWTIMEAAPEQAGWRFSSLEGIGSRSDVAEVRRAAALLEACRGLRQRLIGDAPITPQDLVDAIRLGAAWRRLSGHEPDGPMALLLPGEESL